MPYIRFDNIPKSLGVGRTATEGALDPVSGEYVCIVSEVMAGETETTPEHHAAVVKAAEVEASKPAPTPAPPPDPYEQLATAIAAVDTAGVSDAAAKKALDDLKAILSDTSTSAAVKGRPV